MSLLRDPIPVLRRKKRPAESLGREEPETAPLDASEAEALMMDESDEEEDGSDAEPTLGEPTLASLPPTSFLDRTHTRMRDWRGSVFRSCVPCKSLRSAASSAGDMTGGVAVMPANTGSGSRMQFCQKTVSKSCGVSVLPSKQR